MTKLFEEWLAATRELQETAYKVDYDFFENEPGSDELRIHNLVEYISWNTKAAMHELVELDSETSWKPWQMDASYVNRREVIGEAVDALHFIANILAAVDCTDEELNERYLAKMEVNRERQLGVKGYYVNAAGVKCALCRRALDDVSPSPFDSNLCAECYDLKLPSQGL
jgi:hypothetical protein